MLLQIGSQGIAVGVVQRELRERGFDVTADYVYGLEMESAVRSFQNQAGIDVNGKVGAQTFQTLGMDGALLQEIIAGWRRLASFRPPAEIQKLVRDKGVNWYVQRIEDGYGDLNLDFYPVTVNKLPLVDGVEVSADKLLSTIRRPINNFIEPSCAEFDPFDMEDEPLWTGANPTGAVLHVDFRVPGLANEKGAVIVSHASSFEWILSPIWTVDTVNHLISGSRQVGFLQGDEHIYIYYACAAGRLSSGSLAPAASQIFAASGRIWRSFQKGLARYVNQNQGLAQVMVQGSISQRHDWDALRSDLHNPVIEWLP